MKTLNVSISDNDFVKYNFKQGVISFDELVEKIKNTSSESAKTKAMFKNTPAFNLWQDRKEMDDVENYVANLRKPRQHDVY